MAGKIALWSGHYVAAEIEESLKELGVEALPFKDAASLASLAAERPDIDFALSVNFRDDLQKACADLDMTYAGWSYDSGAIGTGLNIFSRPLREKDFLFLFNSRDVEKCAPSHANTWYLPAAAARSFEREPVESGHTSEVLSMMNLLTWFDDYLDGVFQKAVGGNKNGEPGGKLMELTKSVIELCIEKHVGVFDRYLLEEMVLETLRSLEMPVNEQPIRSLCEQYGPILGCRQRELLLSELCRAGFNVDIYGQCHKPGEIASFSNAKFHGTAEYSDLPRLYNGARINVSLNQVHNLDCIPQRIYHLLAAGGFALSNHFDELERFFKPGVHLETFRDLGELRDKTAYYLRNEDRRLAIARAGHEEFVKNHRMTSRLAFIMEKCGRKSAGV